MLLALPFHYTYDSDGLKIYTKENLTFNHTFTDKEELIDISERYHDASPNEQAVMSVDPFIRKLIQEDALYTVKDYTREDGTISRII